MPDFKALKQEQIDLYFMGLALEQAKMAEAHGEVPVGALVVRSNQVISKAYNLKESTPCATRHAEVIAIEEASRRLNKWRLSDCTLYVTLEPCIMCTGALISSRIGQLVYAASDLKAGAITSTFQLAQSPKLNHSIPYTSGVMQDECSTLLKNFFKQKRLLSKK